MRATKRRFDTGIPKIEKVTNRKGAFGSMYRQEPDHTPDFYDSVKIADATIKTKQKVKPFVDMKKQTNRDFTKLWKGCDAYANVCRENARADYINDLLASAETKPYSEN